jgi:hypothetical protein
MARLGGYSIADYVTSISSGVEADAETGTLGRERSAQLDARLRDLDLARRRARAESRSYYLTD